MSPKTLTLGALAAGFGLVPLAVAQTAPTEADETKSLPAVRAKASAEPDGKSSYQATTTRIGKGTQELRDVPQSVTVVTERLIDDRNLDTLKEALKNTGGISFQAAEGGEEDIRLRGFSLQSTGDIFIDGMRDPAFYERDSFNWDRLELLRGSASMLFGRGSTGGAANQVTKQPRLLSTNEVAVTLGSGEYARATADLNVKTGDDAALRINAMATKADNWGNEIDKRGVAPTYRWGIGTTDEFSAGLYYLDNDNGVNYGLPWLAPGAKGGDWLWPTSPKNTYALASDYAQTGTRQANLSHVHRFADRSELRTAVRASHYWRDQRASAVRFAGAEQQPDGQAVTADTFGPDTVLTRSNGSGVQLKNMEMDTVYLQSDYNGRHQWGGFEHSVQAGVDLSDEQFDNYGAAIDSPTLDKPTTTVGSPADGAWIDESARKLSRTRTFEAKAVGLYAQDLVRVAPSWKLLAGLRWDRLEGDYKAITAQGQPTTGNPPQPNPCYTPAGTSYSRSDSLWSKRFGVLYQPTPFASYHAVYGTSFNTAGDTYQYDAGTSQVDPESSRNIELGARLESQDGRFTTRVAVFHSTKYNERNRDSETVNACNYVLSGERHAAGFEFDVAGRLTPAWEVYASYAWIPEAEVDKSSGAAGTEAVGSRPGLTPRHSGSLWTTYQVSQKIRVGAGINGRSRDKPVGLAADSGVSAPKWVTADLMAEYATDELSYKLNITNVTDKHYADQLYRGHYIAGKPRTIQFTTAVKF